MQRVTGRKARLTYLLNFLRRWTTKRAASAHPRGSAETQPPSISPTSLADATILSVMLSRRDRRTLKNVGASENWRVLSVKTWSEALAAVDRYRVNVILIDRSGLGSDWRDLLNFFLLPVHHCCVVLATAVTGDRLCQEFLEEGGYDILKTPLKLPETAEVIQRAWAHWNRCLDFAYGD